MTALSRIASDILTTHLEALAQGEEIPVEEKQRLDDARVAAGWKPVSSKSYPGYVHEPCGTWVWCHAPMECPCT